MTRIPLHFRTITDDPELLKQMDAEAKAALRSGSCNGSQANEPPCGIPPAYIVDSRDRHA